MKNTTRRIRLYGEEFAVVSDPEAGGIAVHVTTKKTQVFVYCRFQRQCFGEGRRLH
jgi:hypothetical protein